MKRSLLLLLVVSLLPLLASGFAVNSREEPRLGFSAEGGGEPPLRSYPVPVQIMKLLRSAGMPAPAAAGITGNALQESSWNPASQGMGGGGLWGFTVSPVSLQDLKKFARSRGRSWTSVRIQTQFLLLHINIHDSGFRSRLERIRSPRKVAEVFCWEWERPYAPTANLQRRQEGAMLALRMFRRMR